MVTWMSAFPVVYDTFALQLSYNDELKLHWKITFWSSLYCKFSFHLKFLEKTTCLKVLWHANIGDWWVLSFFCVEVTEIVQVGVIWRCIQQLLIHDISTLRRPWHPIPKKFWQCVWPDYALRFLSPILTYSLGLLASKSFLYSPWSTKDTINVLGEEFRLQYLKNISEGHIFQFEYEYTNVPHIFVYYWIFCTIFSFITYICVVL